jgi:hypothetical protein
LWQRWCGHFWQRAVLFLQNHKVSLILLGRSSGISHISRN